MVERHGESTRTLPLLVRAGQGASDFGEGRYQQRGRYIMSPYVRYPSNSCSLKARYISEYPYCGAFQPPPESGLSPTVNDWATGVTVNPYALVIFY